MMKKTKFESYEPTVENISRGEAYIPYDGEIRDAVEFILDYHWDSLSKILHPRVLDNGVLIFSNSPPFTTIALNFIRLVRTNFHDPRKFSTLEKAILMYTYESRTLLVNYDFDKDFEANKDEIYRYADKRYYQFYRDQYKNTGKLDLSKRN